MAYLAWPGCVLIVAIAAMLIFKQPLIRLLDRTKKVSKLGLETTTAAAQETSVELKRSGTEELLAPFQNELILEGEKLIRQELSSNRVDDRSEREKVLIKYLAAARLYMRFDRTYQLIFGSQISALQDLNAVGSTTEDELNGTYLVATVTHPAFYENYSFDQWLNFLVSYGLVRVGEGDRVSITVGGREFLKFLMEDGRSVNKLG